MTTSESWGVNGHTTRYIGPSIRGLAASAGVRLRAKETEISAAPWALRLGEGLYFFYFYYNNSGIYYNSAIHCVA